MKFYAVGKAAGLALSLPVWGAWVEMLAAGVLWRPLASLPVWGAWVEMPESAAATRGGTPSLPVWGAWVEILLVGQCARPRVSLPVWGAWVEMVRYCSSHISQPVAPRVGSVG